MEKRFEVSMSSLLQRRRERAGRYRRMTIPSIVALEKGGIRGGDLQRTESQTTGCTSSSLDYHEQPLAPSLTYEFQPPKQEPQPPLGLSSEDYLCHSTKSNNKHDYLPKKKKFQDYGSCPKGFENVGNTCYANAALQCLLSTSLTSALLDPKTAPLLRQYSSNQIILAMGSGSVASSSEDEDEDDHDEDESSLYNRNNVGCNDNDSLILGGYSCYDGNNIDDMDDNLSQSVRSLNNTKSQRKKLRKQKKMRKKWKEARRAMKEETTAKRKERERQCMIENSMWLTRELTSIAQEYVKNNNNKEDNASCSPYGGGRNSRGSKNNQDDGTSFVTSSPTSVIDWIVASACNRSFGGASSDQQQRQQQEHCGGGVVNPGSITRYPNRLSTCLLPYQQEDAHEFMRALLSNLVMNGQNRQLSSLFDGLLESSVTCQTCGRASLTRDRYMDLSVDINNPDVHSLDDALFEFTKEETLDEDNAVFCQRCRCKQSVTKGLRLATAPSMLVCHLKRFAFNDYGRLVRLHKPITFPQKLVIGDYMSDLNKATPPPYDLVSVLVHQGQTCASGHYVSFVKRNGDWFKCNDDIVTKVDENIVMRQQAYILMYEVAEMRAKNPCLAQLPQQPRLALPVQPSSTNQNELDVLSENDSCSNTNDAVKDDDTDDAATASLKSYRSGKSSGSRVSHRSTFRRKSSTNHKSTKKTSSNDEDSTTESFMSYVTGICCCTGDNEHESNPTMNDNTIIMNNRTRSYLGSKGLRTRDVPTFNHNNMMTKPDLFGQHGSQRSVYAHECESVNTEDSFIRTQYLFNTHRINNIASPINVLEVEPSTRNAKRRNELQYRSRTAPRQRPDVSQDDTFEMVQPFTTFTPRTGDVGSGGGSSCGGRSSSRANRCRRPLDDALSIMGSAGSTIGGGDSVASRSTANTGGTSYQQEREDRRERQAQNTTNIGELQRRGWVDYVVD